MGGLKTFLLRQIGMAWRYRWLAIGVAWLLCIGGWVGTMALPSEYESNARVYVDSDAILTPLLHGIAIENPVTTELGILQRTLLSRPNLRKLISSTDLELSVTSNEELERLMAKLAEDIRIVPQAKNLFTIKYRNHNPRLAYSVVQTILSIFVENKIGDNRKEMDDARRFLDAQIAQYEQELQAQEKRRAEFRAKYIEVLPDDGKGGISGLDTARTAVAQLREQLNDAEARRDALAKEMSTVPPTLTPEQAASAGGGGSATSLAEAEAKLAELRLRYTDDFPDVIAQRKLVEGLKSGAVPQPRASTARRGSRASSSPLTNPAYETLRLHQLDNDSLIASLKRRLAGATKQVERLETLLRSVPGLQAQFIDVNRDYDTLHKKYDELLARREAMRISRAADNTTDKVKFRVVDPPQVPLIPVAPNRILLVSAVLVAGLLGGLVVAIALVQFDRSFHTVEDLMDIGLPVLGGISMVLGDTPPLHKRLIPATALCCALVLLVAIYGGLLYRLLQSPGVI